MGGPYSLELSIPSYQALAVRRRRAPRELTRDAVERALNEQVWICPCLPIPSLPFEYIYRCKCAVTRVCAHIASFEKIFLFDKNPVRRLHSPAAAWLAVMRDANEGSMMSGCKGAYDDSMMSSSCNFDSK